MPVVRSFFVLLFLSLLTAEGISQTLHKAQPLTRQDTLRGSNGEFRQKWDVLHYEVTVKPDFNTKTISGNTHMTFFDNGAKLMQIDLQEPMVLDSVIHEARRLSFNREGNVYWLMFRDSAAMYKIKPGKQVITLYYSGKPKEAKRAPWDGGWIWKKDKNGNPWMSVACQGLGASVWYPCKDYQGDEPDNGATLNIIVPDSLVGVGNGKMRPKETAGAGYALYKWDVKNPINNYNIVPYIGKYVHFGEKYKGERGMLDMDYWVLDYNLDKAKNQFKDAPRMMKAFEHWFGGYPFYSDGFKLVEAPHLGMEHQSAIAYGNAYKNGYMGSDLSGSGWGLKFDFIIIHEAGHEWYGNNITTKEIADMWVHEGFTNYSETLFTDFHYGTQAGNEYVIGSRKNIANDIPIVGQYGVNKEGSGDMYPKAANMIHMIRQIIDNDKKFRSILRDMNKDFYHKTVTGNDVEQYINKKSGKNFNKVFDQYLRTIKVPVLEYKMKGEEITYRWINTVDGFDMPVKVILHKEKNTTKWLNPTTTWKTEKMGSSFDGKLAVDPNFYITTKEAE